MKALLVLLMVDAFSASRHRPIEYVVTTNPILTEAKLENALSPHKPESVKSLGNGQYLIIYKSDPGLNELNKAGLGQFTIHPNRKYKIK